MTEAGDIAEAKTTAAAAMAQVGAAAVADAEPEPTTAEPEPTPAAAPAAELAEEAQGSQLAPAPAPEALEAGSGSATVAPNKFNEEHVRGVLGLCTLLDLKGQCKAVGLGATGNKSMVVERLLGFKKEVCKKNKTQKVDNKENTEPETPLRSVAQIARQLAEAYKCMYIYIV